MQTSELIYLDNAATSWPKPPEVIETMANFMTGVGANPGRSGHRLSIEAGRILEDTRESVATLFNGGDPLRTVFTHNVTEALNLVLRGMLRPGDHVVASSMEHNSVKRPLRELESRGVNLSVVGCSPQGILDPDEIGRALRPETRLVVLIHASNVCGTILPIAAVGRIAREAGVPLLVDAAATAGVIPIDMERDSIDLLAFTGHKGLYGPTGTGGLVIGSHVDAGEIAPLLRGGTGSRSQSETQPEFLPDRFESGTPNIAGLAGLGAALRWLRRRDILAIRERQLPGLQRFLDELKLIPGVQLHGTGKAANQTWTTSFNIQGISPSDLGLRLDDEFGILCRVGLHCAPGAHRTIGTFPEGTVRLSPGAFTTDDQLERALSAVATLSREAGR